MTQIIGIDFSDASSKDKTCTSVLCGSCKNILDVKFFDPNDNQIYPTLFKKCPVCGVKFTKHIINE